MNLTYNCSFFAPEERNVYSYERMVKRSRSVRSETRCAIFATAAKSG